MTFCIVSLAHSFTFIKFDKLLDVSITIIQTIVNLYLKLTICWPYPKFVLTGVICIENPFEGSNIRLRTNRKSVLTSLIILIVLLDRNGLLEHHLGSYTVPSGNLELALSDDCIGINFQTDNLRITFEILITFTYVTIIIF